MKKNFSLAPMAEISHRALRELIEGFGGCDEYYTEMISAGALIGGGQYEAWYTDSGPKPEKLVFQLLGRDSEQLIKAASLLDQQECLGIDINMGCSAPLIRKTGAGVAWMARIDEAAELISQLRKAVKNRLSVKIRTGFNEDFDYLACFCKRLEAEGLDLITLHPRTAAEKFKRRARWDYVGQLKREVKIPVIGNGDISSANELLARAEQKYLDSELCDGVMVGRGAVKEPWIFAEADGLEFEGSGVGGRGLLSEDMDCCSCAQTANNNTQTLNPKPQTLIKDTGLRFLELLSKYQPKEFHVSRARRFFHYFCDNLQWANHLKIIINRENSLIDIERVWCKYFTDSVN